LKDYELPTQELTKKDAYKDFMKLKGIQWPDYLKETAWYNMKSNFVGKFKPEEKEGITKVVWKTKSEIKKKKNIYPNIRLLLDI